MSSNDLLNFLADITIIVACVYLIFSIRDNNKKNQS
jgi:hypothetical protein